MTTTDPQGASSTAAADKGAPNASNGSNGSGYPWSKVMDADSYFRNVVQPDTPLGVWRWKDIQHVLGEMDKYPKRYPSYRRFCALVNESWDGAPGASPAIFTGVQVIHPGETVPPHRHNSVSIYYWIQGRGRALIADREIVFKQGDFFSCPAWQAHEFVNDGDEDMIMIAIHDLTLLAQMRALFWEEPLGRENIQHLVTDEAGSWNAEESGDELEAAMHGVVVATSE